MAFFTSSTFSAENLNTGETEACLGNCSFSRVSFLVCTYATITTKGKRTEDQRRRLKKTNRSRSHHLVGASNLEGSSLSKKSLGEGVKLPELDCG